VYVFQQVIGKKKKRPNCGGKISRRQERTRHQAFGRGGENRRIVTRGDRGRRKKKPVSPSSPPFEQKKGRGKNTVKTLIPSKQRGEISWITPKKIRLQGRGEKTGESVLQEIKEKKLKTT